MSQRPAWFRPAVMAGGGAVVLALALHFAPSNGDGVVQSVAHAGDSPASAPSSAAAGKPVEAPGAATAAPGAPDLPTRNQIDRSAAKDPFAARGWLPPPPPPSPAPVVPVVAEAPPAPTAPPVPFKFVGLIEEKTAKPAAFIAKGDALFVVHVGDVVENTYRVESFNSAQVVVTYLPLQQRQTIEVTGG
jgi:hypothetical protein